MTYLNQHFLLFERFYIFIILIISFFKHCGYRNVSSWFSTIEWHHPSPVQPSGHQCFPFPPPLPVSGASTLLLYLTIIAMIAVSSGSALNSLLPVTIFISWASFPNHHLYCTWMLLPYCILFVLYVIDEWKCFGFILERF